jgi:tripartite-type tricarboxylate transporter receptor subunit TctC
VVLPQIKAGKLRALASTWSRRVAALSDIPTAEELGFKDLVIGHWAGLFAPKGTPDDIQEKMNAAVNKALKAPELRARLVPQGIDPQGGSRADFRNFLAAEKARLSQVAKAANMQAD